LELVDILMNDKNNLWFGANSSLVQLFWLSLHQLLFWEGWNQQPNWSENC